MCPDKPSIEERLAAPAHSRQTPLSAQQAPAARYVRGSSVVARTEDFFTGKQLLAFLASLILLAAAAWIGWHYFRVTIQIAKLENPDAAVRQKAAVALGEFKSPRAVEPLIAALNDPDSGVSANAAAALGQIRDPRALQPLLAALRAHQDNGDLDQQAAEALGNLGPQALEPLLAALRDKNLNGYAGIGLVKMGAPAVDPLVAMLTDGDQGIREQAAELLGEIKDPRAVEPLIVTLKDNAPPPKGPVELDINGIPIAHPTEGDGLRENSARALGEIRDPRADGPLIDALKDTDWRVHELAARSLGEIDDPQAANFLLTAMQEHNLEIIAAAHDYYIRRGDPGTENDLIDALNKYGDSDMAEDMLNSGNEKLRDAANNWASAHNYEINYLPGGKATSWGGKE